MHRSGGVNIMEISPVGCLRTQVQCRITLVAIHSTERPVLRKILFEVNEKLQEGKQKGLNSLCLFKKNITRSWSERQSYLTRDEVTVGGLLRCFITIRGCYWRGFEYCVDPVVPTELCASSPDPDGMLTARPRCHRVKPEPKAIDLEWRNKC